MGSIMSVEKVAVIGTGTMGAGIAGVFAQRGFAVSVYDSAPDRLEAALAKVRETLEELAGAGVINSGEIGLTLARIRPGGDLAETVGAADLVLEAVPEVLSIKQVVFADLDHLSRPATILATNTSGLSVTAIASVVRSPERVVGMHWWNPPHLIPVVEVIRGAKTSEHVLDATRKLVERLGKKAVLVQKDIPGSLGNRMQYALMREAVFLLEQGVASAQDIDTMVKAGFGFKFPVYGPLETIDLAGLDVFLKVSEYLYGDLDRSTKPPEWLRQKVEAGEKGLKSGKGFYDYSGGDLSRAGQKRTQLLGLARHLGYL